MPVNDYNDHDDEVALCFLTVSFLNYDRSVKCVLLQQEETRSEATPVPSTSTANDDNVCQSN